MAIVAPAPPTIETIVQAILEEMGVQAVGQPVSDEDSTIVIGRIWPKIEELNARDVAALDPNNLQQSEFLPFVKIMAYELAPAFSITDAPKLALLKSAGEMGGTSEQTLKDVVRVRGPRQTMRVELFNRGGYRRGYRW